MSKSLIVLFEAVRQTVSRLSLLINKRFLYNHKALTREQKILGFDKVGTSTFKDITTLIFRVLYL